MIDAMTAAYAQLKGCLYIKDTEAPQWVALIEQAAPQLCCVTEGQDFDEDSVDYALVWKPESGLLASFRNLKLIISIGAGVDHLRADAALPSHVPVVRMVNQGLSLGMREYCTWATLHCHRLMPLFRTQQSQKLWQQSLAPLAKDYCVGVLGLGEMGQSASKGLRALGYKLIGWSREQKSIEGITCYAGAQGLKQVQAQADALISLLPLTEKTKGLFCLDFFKDCKAGVAFINAGRGAQLIEPDLSRALDLGYVSHAVLDVFTTEPLPERHPFWTDQRITITPHIASITFAQDGLEAVLKAIKAIASNQVPENLIDWQRGY